MQQQRALISPGKNSNAYLGEQDYFHIGCVNTTPQVPLRREVEARDSRNLRRDACVRLPPCVSLPTTDSLQQKQREAGQQSGTGDGGNNY